VFDNILLFAFGQSINEVLHDFNIQAQVLGTRGDIGYMMVNVDHKVSSNVRQGIADLPTSIRTRVLW
jgi:hypothetical protein